MTHKEGTPKVQVAAAADSKSRAPLKTIISVDGGRRRHGQVVGRARYVPDRRSHRGQPRSLTDSRTVDPQVSRSAGSRAAAPQTSQADSASSIHVTRSILKAQVSGPSSGQAGMALPVIPCPISRRLATLGS